jgi:hypothetical protein
MAQLCSVSHVVLISLVQLLVLLSLFDLPEAFPVYVAANGTTVVSSAFGSNLVLAADSGGMVSTNLPIRSTAGIFLNNTLLTEAYLAQVTPQLSCLPPGGKQLLYDGSAWICTCTLGWSGASCTIRSPSTMPPASLSSVLWNFGGSDGLYAVTSADDPYLTSARCAFSGPLCYGVPPYPSLAVWDDNPTTCWYSSGPGYSVATGASFCCSAASPCDIGYGNTVSTCTSTMVSGSSYSGAWVQINLPGLVLLSSYTMNVTIYSAALDYRTPNSIVLAGSADHGATWVLIDNQVGLSDRWLNAPRTLNAAALTNNTSFGNSIHSLRLIITSTVGGNSGSGAGSAILCGLRFAASLVS